MGIFRWVQLFCLNNKPPTCHHAHRDRRRPGPPEPGRPARDFVVLGAGPKPALAFLGGQHHGDHRAARLLWRAGGYPHIHCPGGRDRRTPLQPGRQGVHLPVVGPGAVFPAGDQRRFRRPLRLQEADRGGRFPEGAGIPADGQPAHFLAVLCRLPAAGRGNRGLQAAHSGNLCQGPHGQDFGVPAGAFFIW